MKEPNREKKVMKKKKGEKRPHKQILNLSPNVSVRHCVTRYDIPWTWDSIENLCAAANCSPSKQTRAQSNSPSGISRFDLAKQVSSQNISPRPSFNSSSIIVQLWTLKYTCQSCYVIGKLRALELRVVQTSFLCPVRSSICLERANAAEIKYFCKIYPGRAVRQRLTPILAGENWKPVIVLMQEKPCRATTVDFDVGGCGVPPPAVLAVRPNLSHRPVCLRCASNVLVNDVHLFLNCFQE